MDEQHPEIAVASLRYAAATARKPGGVLAGREAEIGGKATTRAEAADITDEGDERGGGEDTDAWDGHEKLGIGHVLSEALELTGLGVNLEPQCFDLV